MGKYREFKRPSVSLDPILKRWGHRYPYKLSPGDIVPGYGLVVDVEPDGSLSGACFIQFESGKGFYSSDPIYSFSEGEVVGNS